MEGRRVEDREGGSGREDSERGTGGCRDRGQKDRKVMTNGINRNG